MPLSLYRTVKPAGDRQEKTHVVRETPSALSRRVFNRFLLSCDRLSGCFALVSLLFVRLFFSLCGADHLRLHEAVIQAPLASGHAQRHVPIHETKRQGRSRG